jgi:hypothetical protein
MGKRNGMGWDGMGKARQRQGRVRRTAGMHGKMQMQMQMQDAAWSMELGTGKLGSLEGCACTSRIRVRHETRERKMDGWMDG